MKKLSIVLLVLSSILLSGCITDIVTVPLGLAYDVTKATVKGTAVVGGTVDLLTPSSKKKDDSSKSSDSSASDSSSK